MPPAAPTTSPAGGEPRRGPAGNRLRPGPYPGRRAARRSSPWTRYASASMSPRPLVPSAVVASATRRSPPLLDLSDVPRCFGTPWTRYLLRQRLPCSHNGCQALTHLVQARCTPGPARSAQPRQQVLGRYAIIVTGGEGGAGYARANGWRRPSPRHSSTVSVSIRPHVTCSARHLTRSAAAMAENLPSCSSSGGRS